MSTIQTNLENLQKNLKLKFRDGKILNNAFIHRSYLNEHKDYKGTSNERLEFLGDSVLSIVVSQFLFKHLPKSPEGELTMLRAALVRTETLAKLAQELSLGDCLYLSKGEEDSGGRTNKSILADTFEALIGSIYLDQGLLATQKFIEQVILSNWKDLTKSAVFDNKSKLQEIIQRKFRQSPTYRVIKTWGPDHARQFEIGAYMETKLLGKGIGRNKQQAAQNAAQDALTRLKD